MKSQITIILSAIAIGMFSFNISLLGKPSSELDKYLKKLEEKGKESNSSSKHTDSIKRSDPDLCEKYPKLPICTRFIVNPEAENLEKQK